MKQGLAVVLLVAVVSFHGCDSKNNTVNTGREAVKEVVTRPFDTLDRAKDSLKESEEKTKAALEQADKESP